MRRWIVFFSLFVGALWSGEKPVVVVTIEPYAYLVDRVAEGLVEVRTIVPQGANAHLFEPTPKDLQGLERARLWIQMGEGFEQQLAGSLKGANSKLRVIETWKGLDLIGEGRCCGGWDRHLWLSPRMAKAQMTGIGDALCEICPEHQGEISKRVTLFCKELDELDQQLSRLLEKKRGSAILVAHPSFGYFCRDYGLDQLSIEQEGRDPLPKQLQKVFERSKQSKMHFLFIQPQFSKRGAKQVADKLSLSLYTIDPYAYNYLESIKPFAEAIAQE